MSTRMSWLTSLARDNRVMIPALGLAVVGSAAVIRFCLEVFRDECEIKPAQPKTHYITQATEDALKLDTLDTLLGHYSYSIRETAAKIICDRALNDGSTIETLLVGITSLDYDERIKNLRCLAIITDHQSLYLLHTWKAYSALVRSLELCLDPEQEELSEEYFDEYYLRDMAEKLCLMFLTQLVDRYDAEKLIKAKWVEKWLARQNWGSSQEVRMKNFSQYMRTKNNRITDIMRCVVASAAGRAAVEQAGLLAPGSYSGAGLVNNQYQPGHWFSVQIHDEDNEERSGSRRSMEQSVEEQRLRHRHREAMVLNDGSRPFNSEDIIQRDPESPPP